MNFDQAPRLVIAPIALYGIRSEWYANIFKVSYVPVHQYPVNVKPLDGEDGAIIKLNKNLRKYKVLRRVIVIGRRKKK